jgi:hypothetical protein
MEKPCVSNHDCGYPQVIHYDAHILGGKMAKCEMAKLVLSTAKWRALSLDQRFTYFFLGHAFNELMTLQKLAGTAMMGREQANGPERDAAASMATLLMRLLAGKMMEAVDRLNSLPVSSTILADYVSVMPDCRERLRMINAAVQKSRWHGALRRHTFHYPSAKDWEHWLEEPRVDGLYLYVGAITGNCLFYGADIIANLSTFRLAQPDWSKGLGVMHDNLIATVGLLGEFLKDCSQQYAEKHLLADDYSAELIEFDADEWGRARLPYFIGT